MMKKNKIFVPAATIMITTSLMLLLSCAKKDNIGTRTLLECYINQTGEDMQITRLLNRLPSKSFSVAKGDTLIISYSDNSSADTTLTIRHADSAKVVFADGKSYMMRDTTASATNFLQDKNFVSTISADGKIHYLRYTFGAADLQLAKK